MEIREDDLSGGGLAALLTGHLEEMHEVTPADSVHALDLEALRSPELTSWSVWEGEELVGCGALREIDPSRAEVKSMHVARAHRRRGIGARILEHLLAEALRRG